MVESIEKECKLHGVCRHAKETSGHFRCTKCRVLAVQKRRNIIKELAVEYKGGKCEVCGYNKCVAAMDFHHQDSLQKDFGISAKGITRSWEKTKIELDKCILLCSNCHRETHDKIILEAKLLKRGKEVKAKVKLKHGTKVAYSYHKCKCDICRESNTQRQKKYRDAIGKIQI